MGPFKMSDSSAADELARSVAPAATARELDTDDLRGVDAELARRAAALGKPTTVTRAHRAVRRELERRDGKGGR